MPNLEEIGEIQGSHIKKLLSNILDRQNGVEDKEKYMITEQSIGQLDKDSQLTTSEISQAGRLIEDIETEKKNEKDK